RFDAPMMSFGTVAVDAIGHTAPFPGRSLLTGLLGNALGWDHRDADALTRLQSRILHAVRRDRGGEIRTDYQTVDLGQPFLLDEVAWTTWGRLNPRGGSSENKVGTHIRHRDYLVDSAFTVALTLDPTDEAPDLDALAAALRHPARPLFLGRKNCIPADRIFLDRRRAASLVDAVCEAPRARPRRDSKTRLWWPEREGERRDLHSHRITLTDERDWQNQVHVGTYAMYEGHFEAPPEDPAHDR
ncbi:MAG TPA: type I-E CRISPR-associated protein Cas5/CasD, partial [Nannocystaceae bacterium]|nr:type I-E CRISPR-associated protein Cas5/CasD [Nannocystaceae bacterium]